MEDFHPDDVSYEEDGDVAAWMLDNHSAIPAYLIEMSTRDLARVGLLNLGCGAWDGERILSEQWVRESITGIPVTEGAPGSFEWQEFRGAYGYLWFVEAGERREGWVLNNFPPYYYHSGNRGHVLYVMPHLDLVIAHEVATRGGSGFFGQLRRKIFGSPDVGFGSLAKLVSLTIAAHPDPQARAAAESALAEIVAFQQEAEEKADE
jgi:CubicO group peptidase (beta-lactamase class C family)